MKTIKVLGNRDEGLKKVEFGKDLEKFTVSEAVKLSTDRAVSTIQEIKGLKKDDFVELIFEDDIHRWVTVEELERDFKDHVSRGGERDVLEIPSQFPTGETYRGATTWALKALRIIKFNPVRKSAESFARFWDGKLMPEPGLYRFNKGLDSHSGEIKQLKLKNNKPILLFIHGTFSSTTGGFGGLRAEAWKTLQKEYGERIFGYDHYTLSTSPVENALDLVKRLPDYAKLHLVTHSRGGLVGELLCRGGRKGRNSHPFDEDDLKLVGENKQTADFLAELSSLLEKKRISVERFVRVACPARGTALAGNKLDRWLEVFINVLGRLLPPGPGASAYGVITDLLLDFKKQAADPEAIPGLASMVPESNFIKMINRPDVELDVDLSVIAGDIEKNDIIGRMAVFFADLYYMDEHDLVVQTPAMYGGPNRRSGRYFFFKGPGVHHSSYFSNKRTAEVITDALTLELDRLNGKGFRPLAEAYVTPVPEFELRGRSFQERSNLPQPVVYILPGIMGTHLSESGNRIWLDILDLAQGKMANLRITNGKVQPQALVAFAYADLVKYLSATHEVIPFPFDWRLSMLDEAERFADALETKLKETDQPIRILAHSMGGLLTRAMIGLHPEIWEKISQRKGSRFIMLGTPNKGSYQIPRLIMGREKTFRMLALLDLRNSAEQLLDVIVRFPGVLQLLPMYDKNAPDFLDPGTWDKYRKIAGRKWVKPLEKDLERARKFHDFLESGRKNIGDWNSILYVAGSGRGAPVGMISDQKEDVLFQGTNMGDGTVPWETGILPEIGNDRTYYMEAPHGDLANHKESFPAIYDLLNDGTTRRLLKTPPSVDRTQDTRYPLREEGVDIYPSQLDLETAVFGASPILHQAPSTKPVRVSVAHGNLSFCSNPVAVGHYEGDGLFSAEKALNRHLNDRLSDRLKLGRYPGAEGTVEVILNDNGRKPRGAIIVGLGKAGELSKHKLTGSFATALREYGIKAVDNNLLEMDGELTISTLLIGTGGTGLSVANSVDAILSAVLEANKSFSQIVVSGQGGSRQQYNLRIAEIQFVELFKDQAILAIKALHPFMENDAFSIDPKIQKLQGGWTRIAYEEPAGWWNRISIRAGELDDSSLIFSVPTDRARSEDSRLLIQRKSLDRLITKAVQNPNWNRELAASMFELTIPNRIKGSFKDMQSLLFVVDKDAARYPWELMYDRLSGKDLPLVVQMGMIRQFSTFNYRERVIDVRNTNVMVIGNPADTPVGFSNLPGAEQEAQQVASRLEESGFSVKRAIHTDPEYIYSHLFSKDYRVLHLAGHGVYNFEYKDSENAKPEIYTGMVLGNGIFLTANEIEQKMHIPELVFINCCHLGKFSPDEEDKTPKYAFNEFAASLSERLINMGVKAVIAAGWAVDDAAAMTFADVFYEHLLKGEHFGDAVKAARVETYNLHKDRTNTWGAYQCYGDPAYRLIVSPELDQSWREGFVDIEEAILKINQVYELAKTASAQGIEKIRGDLRDVFDEIDANNKEWLKDARLLEALGEAYGEVFWFREAVEFYDKAIENGKSTASIRAMEKRANYKIRLAVRDFDNKPATYNAAKRQIKGQISKLGQIIKTIGKTPERYAMIGSGYKRLAQISSVSSPADCASALKEMENNYRLAYEMKQASYPLVNVLVARVVTILRGGRFGKGQKTDLKNLLEKTRTLAELEQVNGQGDFWAATGVTDVKLVDHLIRSLNGRQKGLNERDRDELVGEYRAAWRQYGSAREFNSIIEHYAFLVALLREIKTRENLCADLEKTLEALRSIYEEE